ncbi:hypothetical protein [Sphingomonas sp. URHD0057]|uniref:hypothetical protein n=1 Tax=Sphingomonas sp. URHD0057 TaxID=1380389 RepID=UPI00048EEFE5|nr:hypothetical protein [Sphingomonas sp. URHD0057]
MKLMTRMFAGGIGLAAMSAAAPAAAQYPYGYTNPYAYTNTYGAYGVNTSAATSQCTAAVQNRLYNRSSIGGILGAILGSNTATGRVVSVTQVTPTRSGVRVRGLASSGRYAYNNYSPYGVGAYGSLGYGYNQAADLSFRCDVDYRGYVRNVDINRR